MNIQPTVEQSLRDTVITYLAMARSFTSVDIVNAVRDEGYFLRHADGAEWLRRNVIQLSYESAALYNQTLIEVNSTRDGLTRAYLYHHMDTNPDSYQNRGESTASPFTNALAFVTQQLNSQPLPRNGRGTSGGHHSNHQRRDSFGRFC